MSTAATPTTPKPARRRLTFAGVDDIMPEVDRLLERGYDRAGTWSLAQNCKHISTMILGSVDGFPFLMPWLVRAAVGPVLRWQLITRGKMPDGAPLPRKLQPQPDLDDRAEAEALRAAVRLFQQHDGPFRTHPILGNLTRDQWHRLHSVHAAHHFGFLVPR